LGEWTQASNNLGGLVIAGGGQREKRETGCHILKSTRPYRWRNTGEQKELEQINKKGGANQRGKRGEKGLPKPSERYMGHKKR